MTKIPTGLADGKLSWVGAYDMCESYEVDDINGTHHFNGQYCRLDIDVSVIVHVIISMITHGCCVVSSQTNLLTYTVYLVILWTGQVADKMTQLD